MKRSFAIILVMAATIACKTRRDDGGRVLTVDEAISPDATAAGESIPGFGQLLANLEADIDAVSLLLEAEGLKVAGGIMFALDGERPPETQELMGLVEQLRAMARDKVLNDKGKIEAMIYSVETLSQLLTQELTQDEKKRANQAIARIRGLLTAAPSITNDSRLACTQDSRTLWWRPTHRHDGRAIGQGFSERSECLAAVTGELRGLVCSFTGKGYSPHRVASGSPVGPDTAFAQVNNCLIAVSSSNTSICIVDNANGSKFAKYSVSSGQPTDWWFDNHDDCRLGYKDPVYGPSCEIKCQITQHYCMNAAATVYARMDCIFAYDKCLSKCQ